MKNISGKYTPKSSPKTGDNNPVGLYLLAIVISAAGAIILIVRIKKKKYDN